MSALIHTMIGKHHLKLDMLGEFFEQSVTKMLDHYTLTIEEAAKYFRIGESKLRKLAEENPVPDWVMMNGNRIQIKRKQFEKMIDTVDAI